MRVALPVALLVDDLSRALIFCCSKEKKEEEAEESTTAPEEEAEEDTSSRFSLKLGFEKLKSSLGFQVTGVASSMLNNLLPEEDLSDVLQAFTERFVFFVFFVQHVAICIFCFVFVSGHVAHLCGALEQVSVLVNGRPY